MPSATTIRLQIRLFASYREAAGTNRFETTLPADSTVADLLGALTPQIPSLARTRGMVAVNQEYVTPEALLHDGDEVALIPPVSGGAEDGNALSDDGARQRLMKVVDGPIDEIALESQVRTDADGAVIVFRGVARRQSRGREVVHLEYEAYPEMAEKVMAQIGEEIKQRWPISAVAIVHRTGVLEIGQASVVVAVSAPHRGEAFEAAKYAIDRLKQIVPIWKKEVWSDGSQWIGWENESHRYA